MSQLITIDLQDDTRNALDQAGASDFKGQGSYRSGCFRSRLVKIVLDTNALTAALIARDVSQELLEHCRWKR
jgi:hypothetical protein